MNDLVKGILGGGWSVVVGWIVPSAINVFVFAYLVYPALRSDAPFDAVAGVRPADRLLLMLGSSILFGLLFMSLQTPLYRLLEGYLWWPGWARNLGERRQRRAKYRIEFGLLSERADRLTDAEKSRLSVISKALKKPVAGSALRPLRRQLLMDRLARFPAADGQIAPTRLGNGIRRLEWYAQDRYRLDSQTFWYELAAVAPDQVRRDESQSRTSVDFYVCLIFGHLGVAVAAVIALGLHRNHVLALTAAAAALLALTRVWYRFAVMATDDSAASEGSRHIVQ
jgi:hypothetical protein